MAQFDPNPPTFDIKYDIGKVPDIGSGYAAGIASAGKSIGEGVAAALDVANRSQSAHDTLDAMYQGKMLGPDAYAAIKGKSLGAQEKMIGMYTAQWIQQQGELAKAQGQVAAASGMTADQIRQYQALGMLPPNVDPNKKILTPNQPPVVRRAQPVQQPPAAAPPVQSNQSGSPTPSWAQGGGAAPSQTSAVKVTSIGPPLAIGQPMPAGGVTKVMTDKDGVSHNGVAVPGPNGTWVWRAHPIQ